MNIKEKHLYKIIDTKCISGGHYNAHIPGVVAGGCQCGNCKVKVRNFRYHKGAYGGDTSYYDYVFDVEEIQRLAEKDLLLRKNEEPPKK